MSSESQRRASRKYDDANTTRIYIKLNNNTDSDIIEHLSKLKNKQGYIKDLIKADMNKAGE